MDDTHKPKSVPKGGVRLLFFGVKPFVVLGPGFRALERKAQALFILVFVCVLVLGLVPNLFRSPFFVD